MKTLHILNGDSTATIFSKTDLKGDVLVWREILCEGPLHKDVGSDIFWKKRYSYFEEIGISKLEYFDTTIKELIKIEDVSAYDEVVLWFEYDLFCQVNLLALSTYLLKHYKKRISYYLVCVGKVKNKEELQTLAKYRPDEYQTLYASKTKISRNDLLFAEASWEKYVSNNFKELQEFDFDANKKFIYLQAAIKQHVQLSLKENGLNQIERKILKSIDLKAQTKTALIKEILIWQSKHTVYGFGDTQYDRILEKLEAYYSIKNKLLFLNKKGKELVL